MSLLKTLWILQGTTGQYSDRTDWLVRAYKTKDKADEACKIANQEASDYFTKYGDDDWCLSKKQLEEAMKIFTIDKNPQFDYTGTSYWVREIELEE